MEEMKKLGATDHDYQGCLCGNYYSREADGRYKNWTQFVNEWMGFRDPKAPADRYDDTYHFLFRYDIHRDEETGLYSLELCFMLQRKGIYCHIWVENITEEELNGDIAKWLLGRKEYLRALWMEL